MTAAVKIPEHRKIFETLRKQIADGKYANGRRLPSEMELARRFGVSRPTVARAIRDLQNLDLVSRRVGSGTFLKTHAPELQSLATRSVGLLVPGLGNTEILDPICSEITRYGQNSGLAVLWGDAAAPVLSAEDAENLCHQYIEREVAGVFFAALESVEKREAANLRIAKALGDARIPIVLLDRDLLEFPARSKFDVISMDNFAAGLILTRHLINLGHRRFVFVARPHFPGTTDLRLAGCREAMTRADLGPIRTAFGEPTDTSFVNNLLHAMKPDAIICSNDLTAALLIQTLANLGVSLPQDVGVAGFDDVRYGTLLATPLTTIRQPCREMGQTAVRVILERIENPALPPRQILLTGELVIRSSCGSRKPSENAFEPPR